MKKTLVIIATCMLSYPVYPQNAGDKDPAGIQIPIRHSGAILKIAREYFRSHPFSQRFTGFINSLQADPLFTLENFVKRTDSNFFYLSGTYKNFEPFKYTASELRLIIAEEPFIHTDSLHTVDTIINLQLMGLIDSSQLAGMKVQKEFKRFHRTYESGFGSYNYNYVSKDGNITAEVINYFFPLISVSPVTIAWGQVPDTAKYTFTITIRFRMKENQALAILAPAER